MKIALETIKYRAGVLELEIAKLQKEIKPLMPGSAIYAVKIAALRDANTRLNENYLLINLCHEKQT